MVRCGCGHFILAALGATEIACFLMYKQKGTEELNFNHPPKRANQRVRVVEYCFEQC
jgi:hypothetical protein